MTLIYEAHASKMPTKDFADSDEARRYVKNSGEGYVVTFVRGTDGRDRSSGMVKFSNGAWVGVNIHE